MSNQYGADFTEYLNEVDEPLEPEPEPLTSSTDDRTDSGYESNTEPSIDTSSESAESDDDDDYNACPPPPDGRTVLATPVHINIITASEQPGKKSDLINNVTKLLEENGATIFDWEWVCGDNYDDEIIAEVLYARVTHDAMEKLLEKSRSFPITISCLETAFAFV